MGLVNEAALNMIEILEKKVNECIKNEKLVGIHIHTSLVDMHNLVNPEHFKVLKDFVSIEAGLFSLKIEYMLDNIDYDEYVDSFVLQNENIEVYIDF